MRGFNIRITSTFRPLSPSRPFLQCDKRRLCRRFATMGDEATGDPPAGGVKTKLHGRAFYESIGSPKFIVAPMVDQSEFVRGPQVVAY